MKEKKNHALIDDKNTTRRNRTNASRSSLASAFLWPIILITLNALLLAACADPTGEQEGQISLCTSALD